MRNGSLMVVLHAHLPYVRHPEHSYFLEENWLYEVVVECYLPLIEKLGGLIEDGVDFGLALSLSPTLLEMLSDGLLNERLRRYMDGFEELAGREIQRTKKDAEFHPLARMYYGRIRRLRRIYEKQCTGDLVGAFSALASTGRVELLTTAATHAYLPNLAPYPEAVGAQVRAGLGTFARRAGFSPEGFWLPECGYYTGLDRALKGAGLRYSFLETHGMLHAAPRARHGVYRPVRCPSGVAAFARDAEATRKVWCAGTGYPGDEHYRDFYRDIGHDLPIEYIREHIHPDGIRIPTGIKYHRVTGPTDRKRPYVRSAAMKKAGEHARRFIGELEGQARMMREEFGMSPLVVATYDAELFGHWWFEGPEWLDLLLRGIARKRGLRTVTPSRYLSEHRRLQRVEPGLSSWGEGGYSGTWAGASAAWALPHVFRACEEMTGLIGANTRPREIERRALNQALRELLLAQASDWPFLMRKDTSAGYAERRLTGHLENFSSLAAMLRERRVDGERLSALEGKSPLFPDLDARSYWRSLAKGYFRRKDRNSSTA